ncbi:MAG: hypothetical protein ACI4M6_06470 [Christensenellaceae bacterium]
MKKNRIIITVISIAVLLTALLCIAPSFAKYLTKQSVQSELEADEFYFTSDYLKSEDTPVYIVSGNTVTFALNNFIDDFRINETDITYEATADYGALSLNGGTLTGGSALSESITLTYDFASDEEEKEITVTVISSAVYEKTLQAKFVLNKLYSGVKYEIKDSAGASCAELYIYVGDAVSGLTLLWDNAELLIDETNDYVYGNVTNGISPVKSSATTKNIVGGTTVRIIFFKNDISDNFTCTIKKAADGEIDLTL